MASLKEVKNRINSVKSTRQITSAMKMVSSAKLHKAQGRIGSMLPFQQKLNDILAQFLTTEMEIDTPYTHVRPVERVAIVVFSSNNSLCGAYNSNVVKKFEETLRNYENLGEENILIYPVGKKIEETVGKLGLNAAGSFQELSENPSYVEAYRLADILMNEFKAKKVDKVELIYHHLKSVGTQQLLSEVYLPIDLVKLAQDLAKKETMDHFSFNKDYIVEPTPQELIEQLIPKVLCQKIFTVLLDSNASEHAARMMAMQTATDNADDLIQDLTKQYNKSRQQAITNELLDIIGGSMK